jgi:Domain of unknown function (DUF4111)
MPRPRGRRSCDSRQVGARGGPDPWSVTAFTSYGAVGMVLGPCRLHYTLATGKIASKEEAGCYALHVFPERWHRALNEALRIRRADRARPGMASALSEIIDDLRLRQAPDGGLLYLTPVSRRLRRSIESAQWLASSREAHIEPAFREAGLPDSIGTALRMPPGIWVVVARVAWWLDSCYSSETVRSAKYRAELATDQLCSLADQHGTVLVVGHGLLNRLIATPHSPFATSRRCSRFWRQPASRANGTRRWAESGGFMRGPHGAIG